MASLGLGLVSLFTYGEAVGYREDIFSFFFFLFLLCHFTIYE